MAEGGERERERIVGGELELGALIHQAASLQAQARSYSSGARLPLAAAAWPKLKNRLKFFCCCFVHFAPPEVGRRPEGARRAQATAEQRATGAHMKLAKLNKL